MTRKLFGLFAFVAALFLVACADDDSGEVIARVSESGTLYSPASIKVEMDRTSPRIVVEEVKLVRLDGKYNPVDTISMKDDDYYSSSMWKTDTTEFYSPYVKILVNGKGEDQKTSVALEYYLDLAETLDSANTGYSYYRNQWPQLNFAKALASEHVGYLITEKDIPLADAIRESYSEIDSTLLKYGDSQDNALRLLCRATYFDSLYRHDFEELKHIFTRKIEIPDSIKLRAADFQLSKNTLGATNNCRLHACEIVQSHDKYMREFFQLDSCGEVGAIDTIRDASSIYAGEPVGCWEQAYGRYWRLLTDMEKVMGLCTGNREAIYEGKLYRCSMLGSLWEEFDNPSLYNYLVENNRVEEIYGKCNVDVHERTLRYVNDTLYMCTWGGSQYGFSGYLWGRKSEVISGVYGPSSWLSGWLSTKEAYADAEAAVEVGNCTLKRAGERVQLGSKYYYCDDQAWKEISRVDYHIGVCDSSSVGKKGVVPPTDSAASMHLICRGDYWESVAPWEYYDEVCDQARVAEVYVRDSVYFWCNGKTFEYINEKNKVPPTFDKKPCFASSSANWNQILKYDDQYYTCGGSGWRLSLEKELKPPVKAGYFCDHTENLYSVVEVDGQYYQCNYDNTWSTSTKQIYERYLYTEEHKDYCNKGIAGTSLLWNEGENSLYGCAKDSTGKEVQFMKMATGSTGSNKYFAGGKFINDSIYQVKVDDFTIELQTVLKNKWYENLRATKAYEGSLDDAGYKYDPWSTDTTIFIHSKRSSDTVLVSSIPNKSASFNSFYEDFLNDWECQHFWYNDKPTDGTLDSIQVVGYTDQTFTDYESAVAFCPKGYHIPDTTEWATNANYYVMTSSVFLRGDSPLRIHMTWGGKSVSNVRTIFWTSTAKDEETQYCVEYSYNSFRGITFECPKDLYPLVQAMCIRN
ncbi:MAG: hypothetical protein MJY87_07240 [Fibrobacter sp.]|nr:hypothetical protein [Fibrobacter sp.]